MTVPSSLSPDAPVRLQAARNLNIIDTPLEERFDRITRMARRMMGVKISVISLVDSDRQRFKSIQGCDTSETSRVYSFCSHEILQGDIVVVEDSRKDPRFKDNPLVTGEPHVIFYAGCPLRALDGSQVGMLCVIDDQPRSIDEDEIQILWDLAAFAEIEIRTVGASVVQSSLIEDVAVKERSLLVDELTHIWNRAGVNELARRMHVQANEDGLSYAIVKVDLDEYQAIGAQYGHAAANETLQEAARRMLAAVRETDAVGRFENDEFLLALSPCNSEEKAFLIAETVRQRLNASPVITSAGPVSINASLGVCVADSGCCGDFDSVMEGANAALLQAKASGRNRVSCSEARAVSASNS